MYLPKSKQKKGGKIAGKLLDPKSGLPFLGKFVADHLGNFFKGDKIVYLSSDFLPSHAFNDLVFKAT